MASYAPRLKNGICLSYLTDLLQLVIVLHEEGKVLVGNVHLAVATLHRGNNHRLNNQDDIRSAARGRKQMS